MSKPVIASASLAGCFGCHIRMPLAVELYDVNGELIDRKTR